MSIPALANAAANVNITSVTALRHIKDTVAAFTAGLKTKDGLAIARAFAGDAAPAAAAIARLSECDAIDLSSCITPSAVTVPIALMLAKDEDRAFRAIAAGAAAGMAIGRAIGGSKALASGIWPSLLAAPAIAAVTVCIACGADAQALSHAIALALAQSEGKVVTPAARWTLFANAVARGFHSAVSAVNGARGDLNLLSREWLAARAGHEGLNMIAFETVPDLNEAGFKPFPIARQGLNAVEAFQAILNRGAEPAAVESATVFVPPVNAALLIRPLSAEHRLTRLCHMGFQLACAAYAPQKLFDADRVITARLLDFVSKADVREEPAFDAHLPKRWPARVVVKAHGRTFEETVIASAFDSGAENLSRSLAHKWARLAPDARLTGAAISGLWQGMEHRVRMAAQGEA